MFMLFAMLVAAPFFECISVHRRDVTVKWDCVVEEDGVNKTYHHEDRIVDKYGFWKTCRVGIVGDREGCMGNGVAHDFNTQFIEDQWKMDCYLEDNGDRGIRLSACVPTPGGPEIDVGDEFDSGNLRYQCLPHGVKVTGCLTEKDGVKVLYSLDKPVSSLSKTWDHIHEGLTGEAIGKCQQDGETFSLEQMMTCKLYNDNDLAIEINAGCSESIQLDGQEKVFHCGTGEVGSDKFEVLDRVAGDYVGCSPA